MRILIVGAGSIGLKHIRAFTAADPRASLSVIDPRSQACARAAELGAQPLDTDWDSTDLSRFDGVVVGAPAPVHVPYAMRCIREGVPVLSEKPLSHAWDGVDELVRCAQMQGAPAAGVAYVRRYHPAHEAVQRMIASGDLGTVLSVRMSVGQPFTTYRPDYRETYYASRALGGGCMLDFASHFIDLAQYYLGRIRSMCGYMGHLVLEGVEVEDTVAVSFTFDGGALGTLHVNQYQPVNENIIDLAGPESSLRITEPDFACRIWRKGSETWDTIAAEPADYAGALKAQAAAFLSAVAGGPPMRTSISDAAHTLRLCLDVEEQARGA